MATPLQIFQSRGLWPWWTQNSGNGTWPFNPSVREKGIDFTAPGGFGTKVGVIQGGTVIVKEHHNDSIGDLVVIKGTSGYWLYQHLTSNVRVGNVLATGDIVGTENGLPRDNNSNGPHIEVRYSPTYNTKIDSWVQPWINPKSIFQFVGSSQDNSGITFGTGGNGQVLDTLNNTIVDPNAATNATTGVLPDWLSALNPTKFIDATLLFLVGLTLLVVGGWLLISHGNGTTFAPQAPPSVPA